MSTAGLPRCAKVMRYAKEPCARMSGHGGACRTRYSMDNRYRKDYGRDPDPFVFRDGEWVAR